MAFTAIRGREAHPKQNITINLSRNSSPAFFIFKEAKMKYTINIRETLGREVEVDAGSAEEALLIAKARYDNGDIVLDSEDFMGVEIDELRQTEPVIRNEPKDSPLCGFLRF